VLLALTSEGNLICRTPEQREQRIVAAQLGLIFFSGSISSEAIHLSPFRMLVVYVLSSKLEALLEHEGIALPKWADARRCIELRCCPTDWIETYFAFNFVEQEIKRSINKFVIATRTRRRGP
jgi:hypothetical protein